MTFAIPALLFMLTIAIEACALSFILTGSSIGSIFRNLWWLVFRRTPLRALAFCPYCNAFWCGLGFSFLHGASWQYSGIFAITSCLAAACVQSKFGLAAEDEKEIAIRWLTEKVARYKYPRLFEEE